MSCSSCRPVGVNIMGKAAVLIQYGVTGFIALGLAVAYFVIYALFGQQACSTNVPIWVLVSGITIAANFLVSLALLPDAIKNSELSFSERAQQQPSSGLGKAANGFSIIIGLFSFAWFIVGNVWTFNTDTANCDPTLWTFAFSVIIIQWVILGLACIGICIAVCVIFLCAK